MRLLFVVALGLGLAACNQNKPLSELSYSEVKTVAGQIRERCISQGVAENSAEWSMCTKQEISRESNRRLRATRAAESSGPVVCNTVGYTTICN